MLKKSPLFYLFLFFCVMVFQPSTQAQNIGRITGVVSDASTGENLPGANVILVGTSYGAATDRFGNFNIDGIPLGSYTLKVSYIGYQDYTSDVVLTSTNYSINLDIKLQITALQIGEIVVSGLLQGQVKALNQQMNAEDIRNVLSREEIEKFPDLNTTEVLQRIPGVNINRTRGEGTFVYIRGTEPRLTGVTVDGQKLASSHDEKRQINLGIVNSDQLAFVEVSKAITPDMDAEAIGGAINLITRSPFDYEKPTLKLEASGGYANQEDRPLYRFSGSYSGFLGKNKKFGYTLSGSYYRNNIRGHSDEMDWENVEDVNGNIIPFALTDFRLFRYDTERDHLGFSGVLEYKMNENNSFHIRGMYNYLNDNQSRNMVRFRPGRGEYLDPITVQDARLAFEFQDREEKHDIIGGAIGGLHNFNRLKLDYDFNFSYGYQQKKDPGQIKSEWILNKRLNMFMDLSDTDYPIITITNAEQDYYQDPVNWEIDRQDYRTTDIKNYIYTASANLKYSYLLFGLPAEFKGGLKFYSDQKERKASRAEYQWRGDEDILMSQVSSYETVDDFLKDKYIFAPMVDNDKLRSFFNQYKGLDNGLRESIIYSDFDGVGGNYDNQENVYASYLMTSINIGSLNVLGGVRDEYTSTNYKGNKILLDESGDFLSMEPVENDNDYNNFFPYLHLRYKITSLTNLRFAVTRSIARPNYFDLAPYYWLDPDNEQIIMGNPNLDPTISTNLDLMFEHYFQGIGAFSIGLFYKNMDKFIFNRTYQQIGGVYDGYSVEEPINGGSAKLYGIEISWMQQFSFLPGFLNGFGIYANYTYTKSEADLEYRDWNKIPGQAGDVGNIGLSYEKYGLTTRLSLNYNDSFLVGVGETPDYDEYVDETFYLDLTAVYKISKNISFYFDWKNITNEQDREYYGVSSRPRFNEFVGWSMHSGVKLDL